MSYFRRCHLRRLGALVVVLISIWIGAKYFQIDRFEGRLAVSRQQLSDLGPGIERLQVIQTELDRLNDQAANSAGVLDFLLEIESVRPDDLHFSSISYMAAKRITLRGSSTLESSPVKFVKRLQKSLLFSRTYLRHLSRNATADGRSTEFLIELECSDD
jgi:hypothetical protein